MARSKNKSSVPFPQDQRRKTSYGVDFVNIPLSRDDVAVISGLDFSNDDIWFEIERLCNNGYKVSLSEDQENTGGICSVTGKLGCVPNTNENLCIVSRGPAIREAVLVTLYKLQTYCIDGHFPRDVTTRQGDYS